MKHRPVTSGHLPGIYPRLLTALACLWLRGAAAAPDSRGETDRFLARQAEAAMLAAQTPEDFAEAARLYLRMVDREQRDAALFYNLGVALLMADAPDRALDALVRAERWGGRMPGLSRNLTLAMQRSDRDTRNVFVRLSRHILLAPHYGIGIHDRLRLLWLCWTVAWAGTALRIIGRSRTRLRRTARTLVMAGLIPGFLLGLSLLVSRLQEFRDQAAWDRIEWTFPSAKAARP